MPHHGIFVENRLRNLLASGEVASLVVAPVPWFPFKHKSFGRYASFARVPREEQRHDITVLHPRYPLPPKVGMSSAPVLMYAALRTLFAEILKARFRFDLIDAHYFYPDGVAAVLLGRKSRQASGDHGAWHGRESDARVPGSAAADLLGRSAGGRLGRGIRGAA